MCSWKNIWIPTDETWYLDALDIRDEDVPEIVEKAIRNPVKEIYLNDNAIGDSQYHNALTMRD